MKVKLKILHEQNLPVNQIICGDSSVILKTFPDKIFDAIITDPPYGVEKCEWDHNVFELLKNTADECSRVLKDDGICFWFSSTRYLDKTIQATSAIPYRWLFIWYASNNMQHGDLGFMKFTPCLILSKGKVYKNGMQDLRQVPIPNEHGKYRLEHPTKKPQQLMEYIVGMATKENDLILDCFAGSGTTLVAAKRLNRKFVGIEINKQYVALCKKNLNSVSGNLF